MIELPHHRAAFDKAGDLLADHLTCDCVEVWQKDRPIVARHRRQPVMRAVRVAQLLSSQAS